MAEELAPDICVVGGGPGGIAVAVAAAADGVPVVLVEKGQMGGANLAHGTIPSKALVAAAEINELLRRAPALGVTGAPLQVNFGKVRDHIGAVIAAVTPNVSAERLAALGIKVLRAPARFADQDTLVAADATIRARRFVLAVGSVPVRPELPGLDGVEYMTPESGFDLSRKPAHLLVIGAGRHGVELAQAYGRLGIDTTVIDQGAALPEDDPELAAIVVDRLRAEGVRIRTGVRIGAIARRRGGIRVSVTGEDDGGATIDGSHVLVVPGRAPAVADLGLAAAGIDHDPRGIVVDSRLRTTNRRVYAIGDAIAGPALASRAVHDADRVLRSILFRLPFDRPTTAPSVTFTDPAIAAVGLSEAEARLRDSAVRARRFPFIENDRAQIERMPAGMIKVVVNRSGRILGAAIVGHGAGELIAPWALAVQNRLPISAMRSFATAYPTRSSIARRVAATFEESGGAPGLTGSWRRRIIELFRKFG